MTTRLIGSALLLFAWAVPPSLAAQESPVRVDAPKVALTGVGYDLVLHLNENRPATSFRLLTRDDRELSAGELPPGADVALDGLRIRPGDMPLTLTLGPEAEATTADVAIDGLVLPGWTSLLPPIIAIGLALIFKEVVISLFIGIWAGALLVAAMNPVAATMRTVDRFIVPALADPDHAAIIVFSALLLGMVGVMSRNGGTLGIVKALQPLATTPRRAQLATYLGGLAIFFDDYANTLIVGNTMRPITDRMRVSREKLAYIVDSTAAPVASIVFVSTWVGYEIGLIGDGLQAAAGMPGTTPDVAAGLLAASPFAVFLHSIPYLFYPILALIMVALVIVTQRDFGPMWRAENRASRGDGLFREGAALLVDTETRDMQPVEGAPERWYNAAVPVLTVVVVVLLGLYLNGRAEAGASASLSDVFGAADPYAALLWGSLAGLLVAFTLSVGQRILKTTGAIEAAIGGMKATLLAFIILILAWSLGEVTEVLGTAEYLAGLLTGNLAPQLLPFIVFVMAAAIAFATGTSWATMAILIPLVIPLAVAMGGGAGFGGGDHYTILLGSISSVLAGSIWGDHCSPISDTTVLSSMASACDHVDHVRTQLPYALLVGVVAVVFGDIPTAYGMSPVFSYLLGGTALFLVLRFFGRHDLASPQFEDEASGLTRQGQQQA
ncbi:MAG TPA: Na+/H+ antiporter NhaC family protein [Gemmatimonadota bacterium]|nr:Na+/H+ antiporter NhaC family protein [Gemmatimonadota bacterium]